MTAATFAITSSQAVGLIERRDSNIHEIHTFWGFPWPISNIVVEDGSPVLLFVDVAKLVGLDMGNAWLVPRAAKSPGVELECRCSRWKAVANGCQRCPFECRGVRPESRHREKFNCGKAACGGGGEVAFRSAAPPSCGSSSGLCLGKDDAFTDMHVILPRHVS